MSHLASLVYSSIDSKMLAIAAVRGAVALRPTSTILELTERFVASGKVSAWHSADHDGLRLYLSIKDVDGFKDPMLVSVLDALLDLAPSETITADYAASGAREFRLTWNDAGPTLVCITAALADDSEMCRRVIVGYNPPSTEPTPIYELQCAPEEQL